MKMYEYFETLGFSKCYSNPDLYVLNERKELVLILLYVDDLLIMRNNMVIINEGIAKLKVEYEMIDLGLLHYYLGMQLYQCKDCTYLSQSKYILDIL